MGEVARAFGVHPTILPKWKALFLGKGPSLFEEPGVISEPEKKIEDLQRTVGKKEK